MAKDDITLIDEIDESLQMENVEKFLRRYGWLVVVACVAIVLGTAFSVFWKNHVRGKNMQDTAFITDAATLIETGKYPEAIKKLNELNDPGHGTAAISKLMQAGAFIKSGQPDKAESAYNDIINDSNSDKALRDIAIIDAAIIESNRSSSDKNIDADRLKEVYANNGPFAPLAGELYAFHLEKTGQGKQAQEILSAIVDNPLLPASEHMEAKALLDTFKEKK